MRIQRKHSRKRGNMADKAMEVAVVGQPKLPELEAGWGWIFLGDNPEEVTTGSGDKRTVLASPGIALATPLDEKIASKVLRSREVDVYVWDGKSENATRLTLKGAVAMCAQQNKHDAEYIRGAFRDEKVEDEEQVRLSAARKRTIGHAPVLDGVKGSRGGVAVSEQALADAQAKGPDALMEYLRATGVKIGK